MNPVNERDLIQFYQGDITEERRFDIEEFLLDSKIGLMEFLNIKRDREVVIIAQRKPSEEVKNKLLSRFTAIEPILPKTRRAWFATAAAAIAIALSGYYVFENVYEKESTFDGEYLSVDMADDIASGSSFL